MVKSMTPDRLFRRSRRRPPLSMGRRRAESRDFEAARDLFSQVAGAGAAWAPAGSALARSLEGARPSRRGGSPPSARRWRCDPADAPAPPCASPSWPAKARRRRHAPMSRPCSTNMRRNSTVIWSKRSAYRGPQILVDAVERAAPGRVFAHMLDLGCGAGLAGAAFRAKGGAHDGHRPLPGHDRTGARQETSTTASPPPTCSISSAAEPAASADLAIAADVFVYIGDLDAGFRRRRARARPGRPVRLHRAKP